MKLWDYCVRDDSNPKELAGMAEKLGWNGVCILGDKEIVKGRTETELVRGLVIDEKSPEIMKRRVIKERKKFGMIAVEGRDDRMNRVALETPELDILLPGKDGRIDAVMAKLAKENNVRIAFEFGVLLHSTLEERGRIFSQMLKNAQSVKTFKAPFAIVSGALSEFGLRSPSELTAFGKVLGFDESEIKKSMSGHVVEENLKRLAGKWIRPGVEVGE
ncbi:MAG: hypothetical protein JSV63_02380 [Candidatus Aenigmatarchaeota archaeon]|nr:MAG: hypothetical protein JSV63_02380 [Candidatus Aenigmarchaeota archaeon]